MNSLKIFIKEECQNLFAEEREIREFMNINYKEKTDKLPEFSKLIYSPFNENRELEKKNKKKIDSLNNMLLFIQLLCENHNHIWQSYFFKQGNKAINSSINIVEEILVNEALRS